MTTAPAGSTILVTGANGYIGSHVVDQLLARDFRVRGTVRSAANGDAIKGTLLQRHPSAHFEYVVVPEMSAPGAFDESMKGCAGVVHVASDVSFRPNPHEVVTPVLEGMKNILASAKAAGTVKRFVYTSSSAALYNQPLDKEALVDSSSWFQFDADALWKEPHGMDKMLTAYSASKTLAEKEAWRFVKEENPGFVLNAVLPNLNIGKVLNVNIRASSGGLMRAFFLDPKNEECLAMLKMLPPQFSVDVEDVAKLHVAGITEEDVKGERLLAFADRVNGNTWIRLAKKFDSSKEWPAEEPEDKWDQAKIKTDRSVELLRRFGQDGWTPVEESFKKCIYSQ